MLKTGSGVRLYVPNRVGGVGHPRIAQGNGQHVQAGGIMGAHAEDRDNTRGPDDRSGALPAFAAGGVEARAERGRWSVSS